jgi:hypothetical protein
MKENLLSVKINCSIEKLFDFTINPNNTHLWIKWMEKEWINTEQIEVWSIYKNNWINSSNIDIYELIKLEVNSLFHLISKDSQYQVIYYYTKIDDNNSILNYFENMRDWTNLDNPFSNSNIKKLKNILET